eukprot:2104493-Amphidinium_carterae.1
MRGEGQQEHALRTDKNRSPYYKKAASPPSTSRMPFTDILDHCVRRAPTLCEGPTEQKCCATKVLLRKANRPAHRGMEG